MSCNPSQLVSVTIVGTETVFATATDAARHFGVCTAAVMASCDLGYRCKGHHLRYVNEQRHQLALASRAKVLAKRLASRRARHRKQQSKKPAKPEREIIRRSPDEVREVFVRLEPRLRAIAGRVTRRRSDGMTFEDVFGAMSFGIVDAMTRKITGDIDAYCMTYARYQMKKSFGLGDRNYANSRQKPKGQRQCVPFNLVPFTRLTGNGSPDRDYAKTIADTTTVIADRFDDLIEPLGEQERLIIKLIYVADASVEEVAAFLAKPVEVIEQIHRHALQQLKHANSAGDFTDHARGTAEQEQLCHHTVSL